MVGAGQSTITHEEAMRLREEHLQHLISERMPYHDAADQTTTYYSSLPLILVFFFFLYGEVHPLLGNVVPSFER